MSIKIYDITTEYLSNPIGLDIASPRFSFKISSDLANTLLTHYQIIVAKDSCFCNIVWNSGKKSSSQSVLIDYDGENLESHTTYYFTIKAYDNHGNESEQSCTQTFTTGKLSEKWVGKFIGDPNPSDSISMFIKKFNAVNIKKATIYATSLGLYEIAINNTKITDAVLTPGFTAYPKHLMYQTYDVTKSLQEKNTITIMLAKGWYEWFNTRAFTGINDYGILIEIHIEKNDGTKVIVSSDDSFKVIKSGVLYSSIYNGETYDNKIQKEALDIANKDDISHLPNAVLLNNAPYEPLTAQNTVMVLPQETLTPKELIITPKGEKVIDFGQNMVGYVSITPKSNKATTIIVEHAEVLDSDGNFYTENMRDAKNLITYINDGTIEEYHPHFTFQGFRYVKITTDYDFDMSEIYGIVIHSQMPLTNTFNSSNELLNQLHNNILWGQKGNFVDVPTDCPQRDERLGWTGDAQMFVSTACFNMQSASFYTKWLKDLALEQSIELSVPHVVPNVSKIAYGGACAWHDAATIVPWTVYLNYGDINILKSQYQSMKDLISYIYNNAIKTGNPYLFAFGEHFGDWVALDAFEGSYKGSTYDFLICTAFYAYSTEIVAKTAKILGRDEDYKYYLDLYENIKIEFNNEFVTNNGNMIQTTQTSHVLPLIFNLVTEKNKKRIAAKLNEIIINNDCKMSTGFVGTPYLCSVLFDNGYADTAFSLLFETEYPSWLYQVTKGATTIWEHLDGIKPDGTFWSKDMNSFNHYAYGAIGDFVYKTICGINHCESAVGYKHIILSPNICPQLEHISCEFNSSYGIIKSAWEKVDDKVKYTFTVPVNTTATIIIGNLKKEIGSCTDYVIII